MKAIVHDEYGSPDVLRVEDLDNTYSLSEVPEAIRYLEQGRAHGKVAVTV